MRSDTAAFAAKNQATSKDPRYTVELAFDSANTILAYFTSHSDAATPGGGTTFAGVLEGLSGTSQRIDPDKGNSTIGDIGFTVVDLAGAVSDQLGAQLVLGRSTRLQRVRVYAGYEGLAFADYTLLATQIVDAISLNDGAYRFTCADVQRIMRKDIFDLATTTLAASLTDTDTTVQVYNTSAFDLVAHGTSYSDAPSATVGYIRVDDEIIRYTGKTATTFTGCTRGVLNTRAAVHNVDAAAAPERRSKVEEVVYLEMPAVKLAYAILTGNLEGQSGATLPSKWHLGVPTSYVRLADFTAIGADLWDTTDDAKGFVARFEGLTKTDGKQFVERELMLLLGTFMPIYNDGALGLRRMASVLAGAAYVAVLDPQSVVSHGDLKHDFGALHNAIQIDWNWELVQKRFTRTTVLLDADSVTVHGDAPTLKLAFRGLHGGRHAPTVLNSRFNALKDRYTGPPLRLSARVLPRLNTLEVGDIVRVRLDHVRDFVANGTLDRSFEVQQVRIDWVTGQVNLELFASSRAPTPIAATSDASVIDNAWYTSAGTELSMALTITGSGPGRITANGNLAAGVYYYVGDLQLDAGVTVTVNGNVELRVRGHLQINGKFDGVGRGHAGAAQLVSPAYRDIAAGTAGFVGTPLSGGGYELTIYTLSGNVTNYSAHEQLLGGSTVGRYAVVPEFNLTVDASNFLQGLPADLRGSSGGTGHNIQTETINTGTGQPSLATVYAGGAGGAGGAGLKTIARGITFGASGAVDLSGGSGAIGQSVDPDPPAAANVLFYAGSGAGGAPGAWLAVIDGAGLSAPSLVGYFVADYGPTPIRGTVIPSPDEVTTAHYELFAAENYPYYVGNGDGSVGDGGLSTFPLPSLSGARGGARVQYVIAPGTVQADPSATVLSPPSSVTLASGTAELLVNGDGTVVPRIRVTWSASPDTRTVGYDVEFKLSSSSVWQAAPPVVTGTQTWISPVRDGDTYDVRVRAADSVRNVSAWVLVTGHVVAGKSQPPADVTGFSASQNGNVVTFQWNQVGDSDLAGYEIRYGPQATANWSNGIVLTSVTRGTRVTSAAVPPGTWKMLIKARDTSGNYSTNATGFNLVVTNELDIISQQQQAPDWVGTKINFYVHWTGVLIPESTVLASNMTDAQLWDTFVHSPYATCTYEAPEIDIGFDDTARVWGSIESELGPGVTTGIADPDLEVDYRTAAGAYDGFEPWTIGDRTGRYFKHRLVLDTNEGIAKITGFLPTVDQIEFDQTAQVAVAAGGSTITFPIQFHVVPQVTATAVGATALFPVLDAITKTSFFARVFDAAGANVGGTITYNAKGV